MFICPLSTLQSAGPVDSLPSASPGWRRWPRRGGLSTAHTGRCFVRVLSSHLSRPVPAALGNARGELATGSRAQGLLCAGLGITAQLPSGVQRAQQCPCPSDVLREPRLCPPSCCLSPRPAASLVLGRDEEWVSGSIHTAGEARRSLMAVTSPLVGIMGQEVSGSRLCAAGEGTWVLRGCSPPLPGGQGCLLQP